MTISDFYDYCLNKKGVTEHFPFDEDTLVFKVGGKMFALSSLSDWEKGTPSVNLKCDPDYAEELRAHYEAVQPGYHMSKKHWNTVLLHKDVPDQMILEFITNSYELVFKGLKKNEREQIEKL